MLLKFPQVLATAAFVFAAASCAPKGAHQEATPSGGATSARARASQPLNHVMPARDSVGRAPTTFSWTAVQGADSYSIGVWNEVDVLVWRQNGIPSTSVTRPDDVPLEPGTYFWSISALRDGEELADSGLSAFVVRTIP